MHADRRKITINKQRNVEMRNEMILSVEIGMWKGKKPKVELMTFSHRFDIDHRYIKLTLDEARPTNISFRNIHLWFSTSRTCVRLCHGI